MESNLEHNNPHADQPAETLVDIVFRSHRVLAQLHADELADINAKMEAITQAFEQAKTYDDVIQKTIENMQEATKNQNILINAWNGRHQDFLDQFDVRTQDFMRQSLDRHIKLLEDSSKKINETVSKNMKQSIEQLSSSLQMEIEVINTKGKKISHNFMQELESFNNAVNNSREYWKSYTGPLYQRVFWFSFIGASIGSGLALFLVLHFHL